MTVEVPQPPTLDHTHTLNVEIWMPFFIADYLAETPRLSTLQHGAYLLLQLDYWRNGPPPDDNNILSNISHLPIEQWLKERPILEKFFDIRGGTWRRPKLDKQLVEAIENRKRKSERASKAANARWENAAKGNAPSKPKASASGHLTACPSSLSSSSSPSIPKTDADAGRSAFNSTEQEVMGDGSYRF